MKPPALTVRLDWALPFPRFFVPVPVPVPDVDSDQIAGTPCIETHQLQCELLFLEDASGTGTHTGTGTRENLASLPSFRGLPVRLQACTVREVQVLLRHALSSLKPIVTAASRGVVESNKR